MLTGIRLKEKARLFEKKMKGPAHEVRLAIMYTLAHGELPLHEIVANVDEPQNLVSHHMKILEKSGWVAGDGQGNLLSSD
jgi:DNA-binding transcriptional ArsR family regulator